MLAGVVRDAVPADAVAADVVREKALAAAAVPADIVGFAWTAVRLMRALSKACCESNLRSYTEERRRAGQRPVCLRRASYCIATWQHALA